jgi:radical SAM superfamily enzyme YgiQ (UPF0313 family)
MMRVLLISANTERINMPALPLGLGCVAAAAEKAGHSVRMLDLMAEGNNPLAVQNAIEDFAPQAIGVSVRNIDNQDMRSCQLLIEKAKSVIAACRASTGAPIILGGAGYSICPAQALAYLGADMGIEGEGERSFPELLRLLESGITPEGLPGLHIPGKDLGAHVSYEEDLDSLPLPGPDMWSGPYLREQDFWMPFQTRRGCALGCIYCSSPIVEGTVMRMRSPGSVGQALERYVEAGFNRIYFTDNTFNIPSWFAEELCGHIAERAPGLRWRAIIYPMGIDQRLADLMAKSGCVEVSIGFESGCARILEGLKKRFAPRDIRHVVGLFADRGIRTNGFLLMGSPGETPKSAEESLIFAASLPLDALKITVGLRIFPRTDLFRIALAEGIVQEGDDLFFPRFYISGGLGESGKLYEAASRWAAGRSGWIF